MQLLFCVQVKEKVESRNELEGYAYSLKNQIGDKEKLGGKLSDEDKTTVEEAVEKVCLLIYQINPDLNICRDVRVSLVIILEKLLFVIQSRPSCELILQTLKHCVASYIHSLSVSHVV